MSAPVVFSLPAAQNALARSDEGAESLPGDAGLIAAYEGYCQQEWDRYKAEHGDAEYSAWLADQCPACEDGGTGPVCDDCRVEVDAAASAVLNRWHNR